MVVGRFRAPAFQSPSTDLRERQEPPASLIAQSLAASALLPSDVFSELQPLNNPV
jgi:hypothetical protein